MNQEGAPLYPRREFVRRAGATGFLLSSGGLLAACGVKKSSASSGTTDTIKIGYVSPLTGEAASFGEPDNYVLGVVRKTIAGGITGGDGKHYTLEIVPKDSQSSPQTASSVANDLINSAQVDMMLTTSTPEVVNPVADACEAAGVPCISTVMPWQAWYYGRGAKPGNNPAYKFTYHFSFGVEDFAAFYTSMWHLLPTNKVVGGLYPNDSDGNAFRAVFPEVVKGMGSGYTFDLSPAYTDGTTNYSSIISQFKSHDDSFFTNVPLPPDFAVKSESEMMAEAQKVLRRLISGETEPAPAAVARMGNEAM